MNVIWDLSEFNACYRNEDDCVRALFNSKWPAGFRCPQCSHPVCSNIKTRSLPLYECLNCHKQTSLISNTIFRNTRTSLLSWFKAMFLLSNPNGSYGVNARELAQIIQVTYKTAWLMYHKIRYAISQADSEVLLTDIVRVSDSILHQRMFQLKNWYETEQPVIAASSEDAEGNVKYVKIKLQPRPLQPIRGYPRDATSFMKQHVSPEAVYTTDISMKWGRKRQNHKLRRLCVSAAYSIATTYGGIGSKHLQAYLDQYAYIDNHFHEPIFDILLYECSTRSTITYSCLTRTAPKRSNRITRASEAMIVMSC